MQTGAVRADAAHGVLANDSDPDIHDILQVSAVNGSAGNVGHGTIGKYGTLTLSSDGSYSYIETSATVPSGAQDVFHYTASDGLGGTANSTLTVAVPSLQSAAKIFAGSGTNGEIAVLAHLAQAAYHLAPDEKSGDGINMLFPNAEVAYSFLPTGLRLLTPAEFTSADQPSLTPHPGNDTNFPTTGLIDGIYHDENAAALVARSADSLFIAFRGTNDDPNLLQDLSGFLSGPGTTPDSNAFSPTGMSDYYSLLQPLVTALDHYLSAHPDITHVYVTGHSLGASMAQRFMIDHAGSEFQAATFANPGYEFGLSADDPRITNIDILGDPVVGASPYLVRGDIYQVVDFDNNSGGGGTFGFHDMTLYRDAVQFLSSQHDSIPQPGLAANGHRDVVDLFTNISYSQPASILDLDPWRVTLPTGPVVGSIQNDVMGVAGGGILTGGPGNDTFTFATGFGQVAITDFHPREDIIQIDHLLFGNASAVLANTHDVNGHAVITYDANDTIALSGVTTAQLHLLSPDHYFHIV